MIDFDTTLSPGDQQNRVRQLQRVANASPDRIARDQLQKAKMDVTTANAEPSTSPTKQDDTSIARKKAELFRLQQQRLSKLKAAGTTPGTPASATPTATPGIGASI